jgi:hypothetical protein
VALPTKKYKQSHASVTIGGARKADLERNILAQSSIGHDDMEILVGELQLAGLVI